MNARPFPRPVRVYHIVPTLIEGRHTYPREVLHARGMLHQFGQESTELVDEVVHGMVAVVELPDGSVITASANMIQFLDVGQWKPVTGPGQVLPDHRLRFTIGDDQHHVRAKLILKPGTASEEVVYHKGNNFYFITSMVANGTSNHKNVEFFDARGDQ